MADEFCFIKEEPVEDVLPTLSDHQRQLLSNTSNSLLEPIKHESSTGLPGYGVESLFKDVERPGPSSVTTHASDRVVEYPEDGSRSKKELTPLKESPLFPVFSPLSSPQLPTSQTHTKDEIRTLLHYGRCRLIKVNSRSRIWQHFERVVTDLGQDTSYVVCLTCKSLLEHKTASESSPLITHFELCRSSMFHEYASPDSSRSSESASPKFCKEELLSKSQNLFAQQLMHPDHLRQLRHPTQHFQLSAPPSPTISTTPNIADQYSIILNYRNHQQNSLPQPQEPFSKQTQGRFSPRLGTPSNVNFHPHNSPPSSSISKAKRSHQHDLAMLRRKPIQDIQHAITQNNRSSSRSPSSRNMSQSRDNVTLDRKKTSSADPTNVNQCQQAVLDAAVAFCCLDGRWFNAVSGMGLRELAQAFINIGAQFGTMPAERLLPSPANVKIRSREMANLKRKHVVTAVKDFIDLNSGCLAISVFKRGEEDVMAGCSLYTTQDAKVKGGLVGVCKVSSYEDLLQETRRMLLQFGLDQKLQNSLVVIIDDKLLKGTLQNNAGFGDNHSGYDFQNEDGNNLQPLTSNDFESSDEISSCASVIPCATRLIDETICRIINHEMLNERTKSTVRATTVLFHVLRRVRPAALQRLRNHDSSDDCDASTLLQGKIGDFSTLKDLNFVLKHGKEIVMILSQAPINELIKQKNLISNYIDSSPHLLDQNCIKNKSFKSHSGQFKSSTFNNVEESSITTNISSSIIFDSCQTTSSIQNDVNLKERTSPISNPANSSSINSYCNQDLEKEYDSCETDSIQPVYKDSNIFISENEIRDSTHSEKQENDLLISEFNIDFVRLRSIVDYFEPFEAALADLDGNDTTQPTLGKFIPWYKTLIQYTKKNVSNSENERVAPTNSVQSSTSRDSKLKENTSSYEDEHTNPSSKRCSIEDLGTVVMNNCLHPHSAHYVATFLTPYFKHLSMLSEEEISTTLALVRKLSTKQRVLTSNFWKNNQTECGQPSKCSNAINFDTNKPILSNAIENPTQIQVRIQNPTLKALLETDIMTKPVNDSSAPNQSKSHTLAYLLEDTFPQSEEISRNPSIKRKLSSENEISSSPNIQSYIPQKYGKQTEESTSFGSYDNLLQERVASISHQSSLINESETQKTNRFTSIAHFMHSNVEEVEDLPIDLEIQRYKGMPFPSASVNVIDWWVRHQNQLPLLTSLALQLLVVPVSVKPIHLKWTLPTDDKYTSKLNDKTTLEKTDSDLNRTVDKKINAINDLMFLGTEW